MLASFIPSTHQAQSLHLCILCLGRNVPLIFQQLALGPTLTATSQGGLHPSLKINSPLPWNSQTPYIELFPPKQLLLPEIILFLCSLLDYHFSLLDYPLQWPGVLAVWPTLHPRHLE